MTSFEPRYLIYSVTKTFLAVIFCRLADRGELLLDDRLAEWVDDPRLPDVTLRRVLDHTAGIPDYADAAYAAAVRERPSEPWSDEKAARARTCSADVTGVDVLERGAPCSCAASSTRSSRAASRAPSSAS